MYLVDVKIPATYSSKLRTLFFYQNIENFDNLEVNKGLFCEEKLGTLLEVQNNIIIIIRPQALKVL